MAIEAKKRENKEENDNYVGKENLIVSYKKTRDQVGEKKRY
jgi:hypothetical protein